LLRPATPNLLSLPLPEEDLTQRKLLLQSQASDPRMDPTPNELTSVFTVESLSFKTKPLQQTPTSIT
jgi:hypothetical protein